jgi:xanthine dehydrogenase accessory factor
MTPDILAELNRRRAAREAVAVVSDLESGAQSLVGQGEDHTHSEALAARFRSGQSGMLDQTTFARLHMPSARLVIIGAVHISQALYPMAQSCGLDVTIIDPRSAFATPERFAGVECLAEWPTEVLAERPLDRWTALAALTHDPKIDDDALVAALEAQCFYVGALGSRKTNAKRAARLKERGVSEASLERICAPIGLDIGAAGPAEIAVAVLAQIIEAQRT